MDSVRRTKILTTLGPSSNSPDLIKKLAAQGADAFRLNLAHGTHEEHEKTVKAIRELSSKAAVVADIRGSKLRVGELPREGLLLEKGSKVILDTGKAKYSGRAIPVPFPLRKSGIKKGGVIYLDDGMIMLEVKSVSPPRIVCEVVREGRLFSRKGVNIPGATIAHPGASKRDKEDVLFGKKIGADYISLSFIASAEDVAQARKLLEGSNARIIAKIESQKSLEHLDEIIGAVDAVMIARGDLGLEIPLSEVPVKQREIMKKCRRAGVPVIVATQMLASMMNMARPTRAEVSDVANAVFDLADVVMLSGETATGLYPVEAVKTMREIIEVSEKGSARNLFARETGTLPVNVAVAEAACRAAYEVRAKCIIAGTTTGFSARAVAKYRPSVPVIALTGSVDVARRLSLVWGVRTLYFKTERIEEAIKEALEYLRKKRELEKGDVVVYATGMKVGQVGGTNTMQVLVV